MRSLFSAVLGGNADLFSFLSPFCSLLNGRGQPRHLPTMQGSLPRLDSEALCASGRESHVLCITVSLRSTSFRMDPWAHISANELQELREVVDFISLGSLMVTEEKQAPPNGSSPQSADGSSQLQLLADLPQFRW